MDSDAAARKRALRGRLRAERDGMPTGERSRVDELIAQRVMRTTAWAEADAVFYYVAMEREVATRPLIEAAWCAGKTVALPRCAPGRTLAWYRVGQDEFSELAPGAHGIPEPPECPERLVVPASFARPVALIPGLAFDRSGYRLGYGGGYYDRFLAHAPAASIGLCRGAQLVGSIVDLGAVEAHDLPVDLVATEQGVLACTIECRRP